MVKAVKNTSRALSGWISTTMTTTTTTGQRFAGDTPLACWEDLHVDRAPLHSGGKYAGRISVVVQIARRCAGLVKADVIRCVGHDMSAEEFILDVLVCMSLLSLSIIV